MLAEKLAANPLGIGPADNHVTMPRTTPNETLALHFMHRLYEATEGRPNRWRMLASMQLTQATLELAVERGWLIVDKGEHSVALTEAGRERVRRWRGE